MLDAVIIILRETLEASLLVAFLFVYSNHFAVNKKWMFGALSIGSLSAIFMSVQLPDISDLSDGRGQEILFFCVLISLSLLIQSVNAIVLLPKFLKSSQSILKILFFSIIVLAMSLEGAEIITFLQSSQSTGERFYAHLLGSFLGLGIGVSVGAVSYYLLSQLAQAGLIICFCLLVVITAGMGSQAVSYLMQVDLIESGYPIWNSGWLVDERSVFGQLLYALIGYEATPTLTQVLVYSGYIIFPIVLFWYVKRKDHRIH